MENCARGGRCVCRKVADEQVDTGIVCGGLSGPGGFSSGEASHVNVLFQICLECLSEDVCGAIGIDTVGGGDVNALVSVNCAVKDIASDVKVCIHWVLLNLSDFFLAVG